MTIFNLPSQFVDEIYVDTSEDGAKIRFDGNTLSIEPSSNQQGYSITNDWNSRHFTIGFNENSVLYHLTREDSDERKSGKGNIKREEYIAELYGYVRFLAHPVHEHNVNYHLVGAFDIGSAREYLKDEGVLQRTSYGLTIDNERKKQLIYEMNESPAKVGAMMSKVLSPVSFGDIRGSGEIVFARPSYNRIDLIFLYPNEYVGVVRARELLEKLTEGGGSQIIDHLFRSVATD